MKRVPGSGKRYYSKRVGVVLVAIALIAAMAGCESTPTPQRNLAITSTAGGSVTTPGEGVFAYGQGTPANLIATAEEGYYFTEWTGDVGTVDDADAIETTITMNGDYSIRANFARQHTLAISSTGGGSVTTPGTGVFTCPAGTVVDLVVEVEEGYMFLGWIRDVETVADVNATATTITMNGDYYILANFVRQRTLTISSSQGGHVTTPGEGTFTYADHTVVDLAAEADDGYEFVSWSGVYSAFLIADARAPTTTLVMDRNYSITANFAVPAPVRDWHDLNAVRNSPAGIYILMNGLNSTTPGYEELAGPAADEGKGWQGIPDFAGAFDGGGHNISDLFINRPGEYGAALFRSVALGGAIMNLGVANAAVAGRSAAALAGSVGGIVTNCYSVSSVNGTYSVGGLIASNRGTVTNCYSVSSVNSGCDTGDDVGGLIGFNHGAVNNCYSVSDVNGIGSVGGLIGQSENSWYDFPAGATVSNCSAAGSVSSSDDYAGGLVGWNDGTVSNCSATASVTGKFSAGGLVGSNSGRSGDGVTNSYSTGNVTGREYTGGLIGRSDCRVDSCYATGSVTGKVYAGGLIGYSGLSVTSCYSTGSVTGKHFVGGLVGRIGGGTVSYSYSTGSVAGNYSVGGLVGYSAYSTVSTSFWDTETSGQATSDGGTGKTTAEMHDIATFSGWRIIAVADPGTRDPSYIWNIATTPPTYPFLSWQP